MQIHVVHPGETLWLIAQRYGVTVTQIVTANQLESPSKLVSGLALVVPTPTQTHTVQPGENLTQIAQRYGTTVEEISKINQIQNPNMILSETILTIPAHKPVIDVNAYTINTGETGAEDGGLSTIDDTAMLQSAAAERVVPVMAITNFSATAAGSSLAHSVLASTDIQDVLLTNILKVMKEKGYQGLNIDFENVLPADRENYNQFLQRAVDRLHPEGYSVSTALAPKISDEQKGVLYEAHDYAEHGRIVDFVVLMTYEWGYRLGPPQAISPLNEIKRVLDYAVTVIPRNKILFGFQIYARDWLLPHVQGQEAETFSQQEAIRRAIQYGVAIQYDPIAQSPFYRYTDAEGRNHEVWFEDARSAQAKFDVVKDYNLRGISYWVLGYPFPQNWLLLEDNFTIRKIR
ncbi:LysM peptidoglycan-binding domain-containing protein [Sporosarcina sp. resist]|uniref:LysM peptidoglycan-binding domain-containing protein n=1 Tax=Sporosarcina sp. resist TaxID=2762563 RepID=UPI00164D4678|nr:LysM peptidoglycan-binding domain-containing protein [Sporosarcina sp. resist]QNK86177.1 LysM peptidoglycan-binding domain-containing protein [Sporosarcina sp. resist]